MKIGAKHVLKTSLFNYLLFLILLTAVLQWKHWQRALLLITVLSFSYLLAISVGLISNVSFNSANLKFLILFTVFSLAVIKIFKFKNRYIRIKKEYTFLIITAVFGFLNGLGSGRNFIPEIEVFTNNSIPVLEVSLGFSVAVFLIVFTLITVNTIFFKYIKIDKLKWITGLSVVIACITLTNLSKQLIY